MALEASHIRFALELKDRLNIKNEEHYINGAVYPDSRYVTKTAREATHPTDYLNDPKFMQDDFHKGWLTHLLLDDIQYKAMREIFPDISDGKIGHFDDVWMKRTTLKVLQDWSDAHNFDLNKYLPYILKPTQSPHNENSDQLQNYYNIINKLYSSEARNLSSELYVQFWHEIANPEVANLLTTWIDKLSKDEDVMSKVDLLYPRCVELAKNVEFLK